MVLPAVSIAVAFLAVAFAFLFHQLASRRDPQTGAAEWLANFSLESYAPLRRLLDPDDIKFLERQPGCHPAVVRRLRAERRKVFIGYLGLMVRDFNQLLAIGRLMQVGSSVDRPEFARALWSQQIRFYAAVCTIRCRVTLSRVGYRVEGMSLLASLGAMFQQIQYMALLQSEAE